MTRRVSKALNKWLLIWERPEMARQVGCLVDKLMWQLSFLFATSQLTTQKRKSLCL